MLLVLVSCATAAPQDHGWHVNGVPVPDEPWRGHDGPFLALLLVTDDAKALYEFWNTKPGDVPVQPIARAAPGTNVETVVFFSHCQPDRRGNCDIWGTATVETTDGRVLASRTEVPLWAGPPPPGEALGISEHGVGLIVGDFSGSYRFRIVVTDRVANRRVVLTQWLAVGRFE